MIDFKEFGKEPPRLSYNKHIGKVVLENTSAFWCAVLALENPEILDGGVGFVVDEAFMEWFYDTTGCKNPTPTEVNYVVKKLVMEAYEDQKYLEGDTMPVWITPFKNSTAADGIIPISSQSQKGRRKLRVKP